ncbi:MAG: hypothetical protein JWR69_3739 [Pedosphaera sp.]|nr:hypothetical protein [Pedosphaera sp.]
MKTLLSTVIILLLFATGWSCIQAQVNRRLEKQVAGAAQQHAVSQATLQVAEDQIGEMQIKLEKMAKVLADTTAKAARLEAANLQQTKELAEALKTKKQDADKAEQQAGKAAQDRAWWANYRATVARNLTARTVWQTEQNKLALQQAQQAEITRQNRAKEELEAEANANARLQARAAMRSADAAMWEALNPKPVIIIQNPSCQQTPNSFVSGGGYWQTHY